MNSNFTPNQTPFTEQMHLSAYINIIWKRKWVVIIFFMTVLSIVAVKTYNAPRIYEANTRILIEGRTSYVEDMADVIADATKENEDFVELLKSDDLASNVIKDLGLGEYLASLKPEKANILTVAFNRYRNFIGNILSPPSRKTSEKQTVPLREQVEHGEVRLKYKDPVVNWYQRSFEILMLPATSIIDIKFSGKSPRMVARMANAHTRAFIRRNNEKQRLVSQQALEWFKVQLKEHKLKVGVSKRRLNKYTLEQLRSLPIDDEGILLLPGLVESSVINDFRVKLRELKAERILLATKFGPKYPKMIELDSSIKNLNQEIVNEVKRIMMTMESELDRSAISEKLISKTRDVTIHVDGQIPESIVNHEVLQLDIDSDKEIYNLLLKQAKELGLTSDLKKRNISIIEEAYIPRLPVKPNVMFNILLAVVLGLAFGTGFAFFLEYMDNTVRTHEDITHALGMQIPVLGRIPYDKSLKRAKVLALPSGQTKRKNNKSGYGYSQYGVSGSLIAGLPLTKSKMLGQVFLVESATAGEGKTTVLAKSAVSMARGGLRVLMVDADQHRASLHRQFGLNNNGNGGLINAVRNILSYKVRWGLLNECSVGDLFFLICLRKESGRLVITNDAQTMTIFFDNGSLFHLQSQDGSTSNRLGDMLQRAGFITESQLDDALERNQRTGQPLGYILINAGYINPEQLRGPLKLQMEEHLQRMFSWKRGTFSFEPCNVETYEDKRIYFQEDYAPIIDRLGRMFGSRQLEKEVLSFVQSLDELNLSLLSAGIGDPIPEGPLYFTLLGKFLDLLKQRYDVVLVDTPPVLETEGRIKPLFSMVDGVIFVIKSGHVSVKLVKEATDHLREAKANIVGTILNQVKTGNTYNSYYT